MTGFSANLGFLYTDRPLPEAIRAAKQAGFAAVECHFPYAVPPGEVCAALDETGLPMLGLNTSRGGEGDVGLAALAGREGEARRAIMQAVDYAAATGTRAIHVMAGRTGGAGEAEEVFRRNLGVACGLAAPLGINILIEPINDRDSPGYHLSQIEHAAAIVEASGHANLRVMFDCYHVHIMGGDLVARFRRFLPLIGHVQIAAVPDRGEPDEGEVNYPSVIAEMRGMGYSHPIGAEYRPRHGSTEAGLGWLDEYREGAR